MKVSVQHNGKQVHVTLDNGTEFYLAQTPNGRALEVSAPQGAPMHIQPVVANVVEISRD